MKKQFAQFEAEMEPNEDREGFQCFVTHIETKVSNSLALLQDTGEFDEVPHGWDDPVRISQRTLDQIEEWAIRNGY